MTQGAAGHAAGSDATLVNQRDPEAVRQAMTPWLAAQLPGAHAVVIEELRAPDIGGSSETFFISPLIREGGAERRERWVLRIEPTRHKVYMDETTERQFRVMQGLAEAGDVPVPGPLWYEPDTGVLGAPFFLMQRVEGRALTPAHHSVGLWAESTPAAREAMWLSAIENMAKVHKADVSRFQFLARPELGAGGLDQELAYWQRYMRWTRAPIRQVQEAAWDWLARNAPADRSGGLAWGDARPGNVIYRDDACQAVIDWETVNLGGAETDLAWWLAFEAQQLAAVPRLEGVGDRAATIAAWEHFAGRKTVAMEWHDVFAALRVSMIIDRSRLLAVEGGRPESLPASVGDAVADRLARLMAG